MERFPRISRPEKAPGWLLGVVVGCELVGWELGSLCAKASHGERERQTVHRKSFGLTIY